MRWAKFKSNTIHRSSQNRITATFNTTPIWSYQVK